MGKAVFCIANSESQAEKMVSDLKRNGFRDGDISVIFPDKTGHRDFAHEMQTKAPQGAAAGVVAGGGIGAGLGWAVGTGALAWPLLGAFTTAGPLMATLAGAAIGAATSGIIGALIGSGIPQIVAKRYEGKVNASNILISVHAESIALARRAKGILLNAGCLDASITREAGVRRARLFAT